VRESRFALLILSNWELQVFYVQTIKCLLHQYVGYLYYIENLNWTAQNDWATCDPRVGHSWFKAIV